MVNIADPVNPHVVGAFGHPAWNLVVSDTVAFLSAGPLVWYNVADPTAPVLMDSILLNHTARGLAVVNNIAYVSALNQLHAVNVADLRRPEILATVSLPYTANRIIYAEPYLYLSCWAAGVSIYETVSLGIAEPERAGRPYRGLQVSPNPSVGRVVLTSQRAFDGEVMIMDIAGRVIANPRARPIDERRAMVEFDGLRPGVYFAEVRTKNESEIMKLVIR
ncbi:MAG TPA: T9SS type A sorting domain-containing protein [candidate division WOR-3 bacterium]|uniref:T9SS type A sorting domain-containing protein n=1 Tax=candidate division WOR-3 bacterium TaxID=2052148 RepID=A0A7V0XF86_UNCW3|nr:T9SS type A sorting domain-containing protein [candidate division WOR-3 bacterium]